MQPMLVLEAGYKDPVVVEKQYGPVVPVLPYDSEEQVIAEANDSIYVQTSSVWGEHEHAIRLPGFDIRRRETVRYMPGVRFWLLQGLCRRTRTDCS
ncbi:hypothetical protein HMPREF1210_02971 [Paenisporosarcina sp. HGH0030]|nr:hypothetical protein HMPREF1210_02971 [Paenisporosarcina sp. HGH0030]